MEIYKLNTDKFVEAMIRRPDDECVGMDSDKKKFLKFVDDKSEDLSLDEVNYFLANLDTLFLFYQKFNSKLVYDLNKIKRIPTIKFSTKRRKLWW